MDLPLPSDAELLAEMATEGFRQQIMEWKRQSSAMRDIVRDALGFGGAAAEAADPVQSRLFGVWWRTCTADIRTAMVVTAIGEIPELSGGDEAGALIPVIAPEFERPGVFVYDVEALPKLLEVLANSRENDKDVHSFDAFFPDEGNGEDKSALDGPVGEDSMVLLRSNLLLSFASSVVTIWLKEAEDAADTVTP